MSRAGVLLSVVMTILIAGGSVAIHVAEPPTGPATERPKAKPLDPAAALASFDVRPGFHVELVAAEPLIRSPVAVDFDEDGRLFVAEFPEYNQYANPAGSTARGCIKLLTDTDGDGRFDRATVYAADLDAPVAVACWDGGVFVGAAPDLWYFKDTDGDGKADVKRKVLTGFERDRAGEGLLNSFRWGPDNRFHIATGLAGATLLPAGPPGAKPALLRRQNIRFDPRAGTFAPTSGGGQHGLTLDDWGDTFVCDNSNPIEHLVYDTRYAARNPFVLAPSPVVDVNAAGRYPNLHRISPPEPWRERRTQLRKDKLVPGSDEGGKPFGFFTSATGVTVYRGDVFPTEFRGNVFVGEVANNLVYRARLEPKGVSWSAVRADTGREFLASRDVWFRPVQFANAPDGCLYIVDMYRELIEGAAFLPPQVLASVDVAGGIDRGRVYRIVPDGFKPPKPPRLGQATTPELVALLEHANGWHRDTAGRLLYQRQDPAAVAPLRGLAAGSKTAVARMHARSALAGMAALAEQDVLAALSDIDPHAREHGLKLAETRTSAPAIQAKLTAMADDPDPRVRYQLAFSLGGVSGQTVIPALTRIAVKDAANSWVRLAILCSADDRGGALFTRLLSDPPTRRAGGVKDLLLSLAGQLAAANKPDEVAVVIAAINVLPDGEALLTRELVQAFVRRLPAVGRANLTTMLGGKTAAVLAAILADARKTAADEAADAEARAAAVRTVGLAPFGEAKPTLTACLGVRQPQPVQTAALETLARYDTAEVPALVLAAWPSMSPQVRVSAAETLLARPGWVKTFFDAIEQGVVRPTDIDPGRAQLLLKSPDPQIRTRAGRVLAGAGPSKRQDVIAKYQKALDLRGDPARGKIVFKDVCSACHRLDGVGEAVGPDLTSIKTRGAEAVLTNILDPNREVLPQYYTYLLTTDGDVTITGMITAETANTITVRKTDGGSETVQRVALAALRSSGLSAMPDGLEEKIDLGAMADLLAYLNSNK